MKAEYYYYQVKSRLLKKYILRVGADKYFSKKRSYGNGYVYPSEETTSFLIEMIKSEKPFFAGRFGANEIAATSIYDFKMKNKYDKSLKQMCTCAGFFPEDKNELAKFSSLMIESIKQLDYLAIWNMSLEEYYIKKYTSKNLIMSRLRYFEPWYSQTPWTSALKGKKVLVIHPFVDTIKMQYEKKDKLFPEYPDLLPEFDLLTLRAVQTIAGNKDERFETWFDALDYMYNEAMKYDFDIALIGCGAYGFPLAAKLKQSGKQAIHIGGVCQVLFGIKGARWDNDPMVSSLYNENWTRPLEHEKPKNVKQVENACYW